MGSFEEPELWQRRAYFAELQQPAASKQLQDDQFKHARPLAIDGH